MRGNLRLLSLDMSMQEGEIKNRVAESALLQICPEDWYDLRPRYNFDLADFLYQGLILKELDFRAALKEMNWAAYQDGIICLYCSADAIIPTWAFMLVSVHAAPYAEVIFSSPDQLDEYLFDRIIQRLDISEFEGKKVIVKGCSLYPVPVSAYAALAQRLTPVVQSLMFGEPCSNVPLFKKKKTTNG
jgi:hypothetical protein